MSEGVQLIVGLGNPGARYRHNRHNVGAAFVEGIANLERASFRSESRFFGMTARVGMAGREIALLLPTTFMNESGRSVAAYVNYFKISLDQLLIVHDELDLPPGIARFKQGGGDGGHKGIKDIKAALGGDSGFNRLRIGIGHPGHSDDVLAYVLGNPPVEDLRLATAAMEDALKALPLAVAGDWQRAMTLLHSAKPVEEG